MAEVANPHVMRENRLLKEWLLLKHPRALQWRNVRVGPLPNGSKFYDALRKYADAVIAENGVVTIIEAKMRPKPQDIYQLKQYGMAFKDTPEFTQLHGATLKLVFLTTLDDKYTREQAVMDGIEYVVYNPSWVKEYWQEYLGAKHA